MFPAVLCLTRALGPQGRGLASVTPCGPQAKGLFTYNLELGVVGGSSVVGGYRKGSGSDP